MRVAVYICQVTRKPANIHVFEDHWNFWIQTNKTKSLVERERQEGTTKRERREKNRQEQK
jgi:hypothetical protein